MASGFVAASLLTGCSSGPAPTPRPATRTEPEITPFADLGVSKAPLASIDPRADDRAPFHVPFGATLIAPATRLPGAPAKAKLDDGRSVDIVTHRVAIVPMPPTTATEAAALRWLGGVYRWTEASSGAANVELVEVKLPVDAYGHWLWLGPQRVDLQWLADEKDPLPRASADLLKRAEDPFVRECLRLESSDPRLAWRAELLNVAVPKPSPEAAPIPFASGPSLIESPQDAAFLDRVADQSAALWRASLAALRRSDREIFRQVVDQLALVIEAESSGRAIMIPAWPGPEECADLLERLLQDVSQPRRLAAAAREWLRTRPAACAWIADDAGLLETSSSVPLVRVGVVNFGPSRALVSSRGVIDVGSPEIATLAPRSAAMIPVAPLLSPAPPDGSAESWAVDVRCGEWSALIDAQRRHLVALPPGLDIGSFALDHAVAPWSRSRSLIPLSNPSESRRDLPALAGRLVRDAGPGGVGVGSGWSLYLEAERSTSERQTIRAFFGPFAAPSAVVTAELPEITAVPESGEGTATVRLPGRGESTLVGARVVPGPDRWAIRLPIPNSAIERPGRLRLAIEHVRGNARSTWPRAQFPWQTEPGRASVDLTKW